MKNVLVGIDGSEGSLKAAPTTYSNSSLWPYEI